MAIDIEALKAKLENMNNQGRGRTQFKSDLWKPDYGKYLVRPIPWPEGVANSDTAPFLERWFYYGLGSRVVAPKLGEPDPVRELRDALFSDRTEANLALARKLKPKMRVFLPVIVDAEDGTDGEKEVKIWSISQTVYKQLLGYIVDPDYGDMTDLETGRCVTVEITDSGKKFEDGTKIKDIDVRPKPKSSPITKKEKELLESIPDIDSVYPICSYDSLEESLNRYINSGVGSKTETRGGNQTTAPAGNKPQTSSLNDAFDDLLNG